MKQIHFFDLDGTLWSLPSKWWLINSNNPQEPIIKITQEQGAEIFGGFHAPDNKYGNPTGVQLSPTGIAGGSWLAKDIWSQILKVCPSCQPEQIDIGFPEFGGTHHHDQKEVVKLLRSQVQEVSLLLHNANHLPAGSDVGILTARGNRMAHGLYGGSTNYFFQANSLLDFLSQKLAQQSPAKKLNPRKIYFVNDELHTTRHGKNSSAHKKMMVCLEHLVGLKLEVVPGQEKHRKPAMFFGTSLQDVYNEVHFYDDEHHNIEVSQHVNQYFQSYYTNSVLETQAFIRRRVTKNKLVLNVHSLVGGSGYTTTNHVLTLADNVMAEMFLAWEDWYQKI